MAGVAQMTLAVAAVPADVASDRRGGKDAVHEAARSARSVQQEKHKVAKDKVAKVRAATGRSSSGKASDEELEPDHPRQQNRGNAAKRVR